MEDTLCLIFVQDREPPVRSLLHDPVPVDGHVSASSQHLLKVSQQICLPSNAGESGPGSLPLTSSALSCISCCFPVF